MVADQEVNHTLHHPRGVGLTWVSPGSDHDAFLQLVDLIRDPVGDGQVLALVTGNGSAKGVPGHEIELLGLDLTQVVAKIGVSVWL